MAGARPAAARGFFSDSRQRRVTLVRAVRRTTAQYLRAFQGLPRASWLLTAVVFVHRAGTMVLPFLTLYLTGQKGMDPTDAGLLLGLWGVGSLIGSSLGGVLCDRYGGVPVAVAGLLCAGAGLIALGQVESPAAIGVLLFATTALGDIFRPASSTTFANVCPPDLRTRGMALNRLAINAGSAVGPALGGFLAQVNYEFLFWLDGGSCLLAAGLLWSVRAAIQSHATAPESDAAADAAASVSPFGDRLFLVCLGLVLCVGLVFMQMFSTVTLFLEQQYHLNEAAIGLLFGINPVLILLLEMPLVHRLEGRPPLRWIALGTVLIGAGFALLPLGSTFAFGVVVILVLTAGEMLESPLVAGFIATRAPDAQRGRYMGLYVSCFALASVIAPPLGAAVYQHLGADVLFYSCGVVGVLTAAGYAALHRATAAQA